MRVCPRCKSIYSVHVDRCGIDGTAIVEQEEDPLVGEEVDRYRILEPLGRGAMGAVYRAAHAVLDHQVAIKVLYGNFALNQRLIERFKREAQAIGKMRHPNIVDVIDFGRTTEGLTFLVMELVDGQTLEDVIAREAPFSPVRAAQIARQIASGLGEAHRRGFVHRDMKPSNVMLTHEGEIEMVKILDFGVVGLIQAAAAAKLTAVGHIVGTPTYMAPEQARSSTVTPAADLYALGVILYEMLSGRPPFEGNGIAEVLLMHLNQPPPPLHEAKGLEKIVAQLLEKKTEKRLPNAARVLAELDRLNLKIAKTEQILVSNVLKMTPKPPSQDRGEYSESVEVQTEEHEVVDMRRAAMPMPQVEHESTDPEMNVERPGSSEDNVAVNVEDGQRDDTDRAQVVDVPREKGVAKDPSDEDRPRLVAPSLSDLEAAMPAETALDAPTQLDFRMTPGIDGPIANLYSQSSADTAPPEEDDEHDANVITADIPKSAAVVLATHERTLRDLPRQEKLPEPRIQSGPHARAASGPRSPVTRSGGIELRAPDVPLVEPSASSPATFVSPTFIPSATAPSAGPPIRAASGSNPTMRSPVQGSERQTAPVIETAPVPPDTTAPPLAVQRPLRATPPGGSSRATPRPPSTAPAPVDSSSDRRFKIVAGIVLGVITAAVVAMWLLFLASNNGAR